VEHVTAREVAAGCALVAIGLLWAYGAEASWAPAWTVPLTLAHLLAGAPIGRWWVLLLPPAIILLSIPVPTPAGADSTTFGYVLIYELVIGLPITAIGVLIGRMSRGRGAILDRDPWR
jgi:hypothetical protein